MSHFNAEFHQIEVTDADGTVVTAFVASVLGGFEIDNAWTTSTVRNDQGKLGIRREAYKKTFTDDMIDQINQQL